MNRHTQKHKSPYTRGGSPLRCAYSCTLFALICAFLLPSPAVATPSPDPATIRALAADAYVWGLGLETVYRLSKYNTIIGAPYNAMKYGSVPAAWNNEATNAGDASVVYVSAFVNFDESHELVFTVPPAPVPPVPPFTYYVAAYYDAYGNDVGSFGTRTTPSTTATSYLLVGPTSPFAHKKTAKIQGYTYPVMASDTNINWFLIRVRANTLIDASDPTSVPSIVNNVSHKFYLNTLHEFEKNGHQPVPPANDFFYPPPNQEQLNEAAPYQNTPVCAVDGGGPHCSPTPANQPGFFNQLGDAVASNPIPKANTGLSGTLVSDLPAYVIPQYGTSPTSTYFVPSYGQQEKFDSFAPIGLKKNGFRVPNNWTQEQLDALYAGYRDGQQILQAFITGASSDECTNYWGIVNDFVGTYPNNDVGYLYRSFSAAEGGVSNYPLDAVYPTMLNLPTSDNSLQPLDGNNTYMVTFTLPPSSPIPGPCTSPSPGPVSGILPPMYPDPLNSLDPAGFWSIHVYAQDPSQAAAPFIAQTSVLNTYYSTANLGVLSVDAAADTMTVSAPDWGTIVSSTPVLFGGDTADYGLTPGAVYYVVCSDTGGCPNADGTSTFQISTQWIQQLSNASPPVPIQGPAGVQSHPGPIVDLLAGSGALNYGMVKPVTQLGSTQLSGNSPQLYINPDNSVTLWFGPVLPPGAPASNWIPTPNTAYYQALYGQQISTNFQLTLRMYYPWGAVNPPPSGEPPSILPCTVCSPPLHESYVPPTVVCVPEPGQTCP